MSDRGGSCPLMRDCDAGGPEQDGGHDFSVPFERETPSGGAESGFKCSKCGVTNIGFWMVNGP